MNIRQFLKRLFLNQKSKAEQQKSLDAPSKEQKVPPQITMIEETDTSITALVSRTAVSTTPSVTTKSIKDDIFLKELPQGEYWKEEFSKEIIVLHFTAGYNWESAYNVFKGPGRVATPFIVDIKGPKYIIQLFDEKYWSYHLGIAGPDCKNWANDKRSIGIEIVNIGPAWLKNGTWKDYLEKVCPVESIMEGKNRDADGGVKFPDKQVEAVCDLINHLCDKWNILRQVPTDKMSYQLSEVAQFKGIVTHQMFRQDKYDMGAAWPWAKIIEKCQLKEISIKD